MGTVTTTSDQPGTTRPAIVLILAISAAASLFLFWLIYHHPAEDSAQTKLAFLPALNAFLNGSSATALVIGFVLIRARRIRAHRAAMTAAFLLSSLFLASYILHHYLHGDVRYPLEAPYRGFYLSLLASHILLAVIALPMVLLTFFLSLSGRIPQHRKLARWTFPVWLYVSLTGVITYVMLRLAQGG